MYLLFVHADALGFEATRPRDDPEQGLEPEGHVEDCLAVFVGVERGDPDSAVPAAATHLREAAADLRTERLALVPAPVLADEPADAERAAAVLGELATTLDDLTVQRAPAGWDLAVDLRGRGHPLAVQSHVVDPATAATARTPEWTVHHADGTTTPLDDAPDSLGRVAAAVDAESPPLPGRERLVEGGLLAADPDAPHWFPRGATARDLLWRRARGAVDEAGVDARPVATPTVIDLGRRPVAALVDRIAPAAALDSGGACRPDAAPGHLTALAAADLGSDPAAALPLSVVERARTAAAGEERAQDRTRPTVTTLLGEGADVDAAISTRLQAAADLADALGLAPTLVIRVGPGDHDSWLRDCAGEFGPVLVDRRSDRPAGWISVTLVDTVEGNSVGLARVRVDTESPAAFGIDAAAAVHWEPVGALGPTLGVAADAGGLPRWLAPTQVRLVPIEPDQVKVAREIAGHLADAGGRVVVDDRDRPVAARRAAAASALVPYSVVVGDREADGAPLAVHDHRRDREESLSVAALADRLADAAVESPRPHHSAVRSLSGAVFGEQS